MAKVRTRTITKPQARDYINAHIKASGLAGDVKFDKYLGNHDWEVRVGNIWYVMRAESSGQVTHSEFSKR